MKDMDSVSKPLLGGARQVSEENNGAVRTSPFWTELRKQFDLAGPMVVTNFSLYSISVVSIMFVGHLGELQLSSASTASAFASVTGFTVLTGLSSALETLCGQAYGAQSYHLLSIYLQAAVLILLAVSIPIAILWWNMEPVLVWLGQDPEISRWAGVYFAWLSPSLFALAISQPLQRFLQAQSLVLPLMSCSTFAILVQVPVCHLLVNVLGLGFKGGALAVTIAYYVNVILLLGYVNSSKHLAKTWNGLTTEAFEALAEFFKLSVPSAAMICLEYWAFEVLTLLAGILPNPQLQVSVLSICLTTGSLAYMIPLGLSGAISTRVSNELGAGRPAEAKFAVRVVICIAVTVSGFIAATEFLMRNVWGRVFSDEAEVVRSVAKLMPLIAGATLMDGVQGSLTGVARGCGWQEAGAWVNLFSYYAVGLPSAVLLGYYFRLQSLGLWLGFYCGAIVQVGLLLLLTLSTNWVKMAEDAKRRTTNSLERTAPSTV